MLTKLLKNFQGEARAPVKKSKGLGSRAVTDVPADVTPLALSNELPVNGLITEISKIRGIEITKIQEIVKFQSEYPELPAFYDSENILYMIPDRELSQGDGIKIRELGKLISKHTGSHTIKYVTPNVLEAFKHERTKTNIQTDSNDGSASVLDILTRAVNMHATDIHIHTKGSLTTVDYRCFGNLRRMEEFTSDQGQKIVNAIWQIEVKASIGGESAKDGRFVKKVNGETWMFRVSYGQSKETQTHKTVIRLRNMREIPPLDDLGYDASQIDTFRIAMGNRGVILIVGSVNSGKSTTQTAILEMLPRQQSTIEISDQIEVELDHVVQLQLPTQGNDEDYEKNRLGLLKLPTRQDCNFIAINEIRDRETAEMLASMMMQGTQGITSIHAGGWGGAINRLRGSEMAVEDSILFSDSFFNLIIFQTLAGVLCDTCKLTEHPDPTKHDFFAKGFGSNTAQFIRYLNPTGCDDCNFRGVKGLTLVAEVIKIDQSNRQILRKPDDSVPMINWMKQNGILNVHQHALTKIARGEIDPDWIRSKIGDYNKLTLGQSWHIG